VLMYMHVSWKTFTQVGSLNYLRGKNIYKEDIHAISPLFSADF
jgi:hypothetical protein